MTNSSLADIEQTQQDLRISIEASKVLTEKSAELIARHRQQADIGAAGTGPIVPAS